MAGALAERDFVEKLEKAGFEAVEVVDRDPRGMDFIQQVPLFTEELLGLMRELIPPEKQSQVAVAIVVRAMRRNWAPNSMTVRTPRPVAPFARSPRRRRSAL